MLAIATRPRLIFVVGRRLHAPQGGVPVAGVVAHAGQERDLAREQVSQDHDARQDDEQSAPAAGVQVAKPDAACPTNNASTPKIMKTFHSSGTPIGIADRMPKWKHDHDERRRSRSASRRG